MPPLHAAIGRPRRPALSRLLAGAFLGLAATAAHAQDARPNIVLIVADDLGYSDLGAFGSEIATPNLDALASGGVQLTGFYAAPACSPTRAMLLTGTDNHVAGLGNMAELMADSQRGRPGYEGGLNDRVVTFPQLLQDAGYRTYMTGKWHLGGTPGQLPVARGFDESTVLLGGAAGHYDNTGTNVKVPTAAYRRDAEPFEYPTGTYSTDFYTDTMLDYLKADAGDDAPFFAYLAYTAPHWPLQAPAESVDRYAHVYDAGFEAIAAERLARMKALGLTPEDGTAAPLRPEWPAWSDLTEKQKVRESRLMQTYAGMVDNLDSNVGRFVSYLKEAGEYENTVFVFLSDNGPEGNDPEETAPGNAEWIAANFDNATDNIGAPSSFVGYGPVWAAIGSTPHSLFKGFTYEGGIHVPAFVTAPGRFAPARRGDLVSVMDVAPTILDLAGVEAPGGTYDGHAVAPMQGVSQVAALAGGNPARGPEDPLAWELVGRIAVREGDWKLVWSNPPYGIDGWQLFDLATDPGETRDLAPDQPARTAALTSVWEAYRDANGVVWSPNLAREQFYTNNSQHFSLGN